MATVKGLTIDTFIDFIKLSEDVCWKPLMQELGDQSSGVVVTGQTGAGKSTSISMGDPNEESLKVSCEFGVPRIMGEKKCNIGSGQ